MGPAFVGVDVVREGVDRLGVAVVPLQRDLDVDAVLLAAHVDRLVVRRRPVLIQILDERVDAAFVQEVVRLAVALVLDGDGDAAVQEGELPQPLRQGVEAVFDGLEDLRIRLERDLGAALLRGPGDLERDHRIAAVVGLLVDLAVAPDFQIQGLGQGVDDRDADAVQPAGDLVAVVVELAAGVEHRQHHFGRRTAALVEVDRNAAAVVDHGHGVVDVDRDVDLVAVAGERLVYRVVDDLVDEVMQARRSGRADVHRRPLAHGLEAFEDLDFVRAVVVRTRTIPVAVAGRNRAGVVGDGGRIRRGVEVGRPLIVVRWFQL